MGLVFWIIPSWAKAQTDYTYYNYQFAYDNLTGTWHDETCIDEDTGEYAEIGDDPFSDPDWGYAPGYIICLLYTSRCV